MEKGGFQNHPLMRLTLYFTLLFILGLWISSFLVYFSKMGLTPSSVVSYYLGSEANFTVPRTYQSMLEVTHIHLPIMAVVILILTHLIIFSPFSDKVKIGIIGTTFVSGFLNEAASWLVRFGSPHFAYLKIFTFLVFQAMMFFLLLTLGTYLWTSAIRKRRKKA